MKILRPALASLLFAFAGLATLPADEKPGGEKHTELETKMENMNAAWRKLRRQIADPAQNASSLELLAEVRASSTGADKLTPIKTADIPEAERAKFQADFEAGMKKLAGLLDQMEQALKAGQNEDANKILADVNNLQRESHKAFRRPPPEKK